MDGILNSAANERDAATYLHGSCHAFAVALHRELGWGLMVVTDPGNPYREDPADADNAIPSVTHVYAVDPDGAAWDVLGCRPKERVDDELLERHPEVSCTDCDEFAAEGGLVTYVEGMGEDVDRPLHALTDQDVARAWDCACRVLADVPGFGRPSPSP